MAASLTMEHGWARKGRPLRRLLVRVLTHVRYALSDAAEHVCKSAPRHNAQHLEATAERLFTAYGNAVLRLAYTYLHNLADAEEVLQDTLVQFLKTSPVLHDAEHEKAWMLHVAANLSKNRLKRNAVRKADELHEDLIAEHREDLAFVWAAVKELPENMREVVHLYYHEGYPTAQIASILEMNESTVRSNLTRGRKRLREILEDEYDFD